jgi:hypothetical protein
MNARIYWLLLGLCPADLRREFGAEMTHVFLEDLEDSQVRFGFRGVARTWRRSLKDLCGAALQEAIARRQFVAPMIAYGLMQLWFALVYLVHSELPSHELILISSLYGLILAIIAFAVVRVADSNVPESLKLERW